MQTFTKDNRLRQILSTSAAIFTILLISGVFLSPLQSKAWKEIQLTQGEFSFDKLDNSLGQGLIIGICGGFRNIVADIAWLKVDQYWRKQESAATEAWINTAVTIDPRPKFFWTNGVRILALDMPAWEIKANGGWNKVPEVAQHKIIEAHAWKGIEIVDRALEYFPNDHDLITDKANIYYRRLADTETATTLYKQAADLPNSPYYLKEIYAQLLLEMDQLEEALVYLKSIHPEIPERFKPEIRDWIIGIEMELSERDKE